jgi:hypothetical protein
MADSAPSANLWDALFDERRLPDAVAVRVEADTGMAPVVAWLKTATLGGAVASVRESLAEGLQQALNTPLTEIVGTACSTYKDLLEYADATRHPAGEVSLVPLGKHVVESTHAPYVQVFIAGNKVGHIEFKARVALTIESAILKIRDGRIWELQTGAASAEASLELGPAVLVHPKSRQVKFPGRVEFSKGLPIAVA